MTDGRVSRISLSGAVTVQTVSASFEELKRAADEAAKSDAAGIEIDIAGVTDADLTLVQLIESARRSAALSGTPLRLSAPASGAVLALLQRGGFLGDEDPQRAAFWLSR